jgi:hypothetical protein
MNDKDDRIKELEEENERLRKKLREINAKLSRCLRSLNKERDANFERVDFSRDR